jgi:hypothetical protein
MSLMRGAWNGYVGATVRFVAGTGPDGFIRVVIGTHKDMLVVEDCRCRMFVNPSSLELMRRIETWEVVREELPR